MVKIVTVFGATGSQGRGVVAELIKSKEWHVRAVTRNVESAAAKALKSQGVDIVMATLEDTASVERAIKGAYAVYGVTDYWQYIAEHGDVGAAKIETQVGISFVNLLAKSSALKHFVWSTLPEATLETRGKVLLPHWQGKAEIDKHIKDALPELAAKTTFLWVAFYADNLSKFEALTPIPFGDSGKYIVMQPCPADTLLPVTGCVSENTGIYVRTILTRPEVSLPGKYAIVYTAAMTFPQLLAAWSIATGNDGVYISITVQEATRLWGQQFAEELNAQYQYMSNVPDAMVGEPGVLTKEELGVMELLSIEDTFKQKGNLTIE